jgi:hypothetical protein
VSWNLGDMFNGLWFRVFEASGLIFKGSWSRAYGPGFRVYGPGFRVYGPGFRVLGFRVYRRVLGEEDANSPPCDPEIF